ncbi:hypothetical protein [Haloquadratum walsbyi]|jgi:hypothetical protein|uniref:Uncharacterized protein n=1 Tax=Haloquadratum walsbyi J07HQW2 TaxID=1238425 RepID=U1PUY8_9EURY|nr:hypothetical protein [Haloquadratum walsbyi]ERG96206.1 MAG: hypothetical protein J07HQW2_02681 [Haloquadratum walsbyi J07HQW2]
MSDILGAITGTATYEKVEIEVQNSRYKITGEHQGSEVVYKVPHGCLQIEDMHVELAEESIITLTAPAETFIWIDRIEDTLNITRENPT